MFCQFISNHSEFENDVKMTLKCCAFFNIRVIFYLFLYTVPLKSKLPIASRFLKDHSLSLLTAIVLLIFYMSNFQNGCNNYCQHNYEHLNDSSSFSSTGVYPLLQKR